MVGSVRSGQDQLADERMVEVVGSVRKRSVLEEGVEETKVLRCVL